MKKMLHQFLERMDDPQRRDSFYVLFSSISMLLIPQVGWNPFLLTWCGYVALLLRACTNKKIALFYKVLVVLILIMVATNIVMGLFSLHFSLEF